MKLWLYLAIASAIAGAFYWTYSKGVENGRNKTEFEWAKDREAQSEKREIEAQKQSELVAELAKQNVTREVIYRDKIKTVYHVVDECIDRSMPADIIRLYKNSVRKSTNQSGTDIALR